MIISEKFIWFLTSGIGFIIVGPTLWLISSHISSLELLITGTILFILAFPFLTIAERIFKTDNP